MKIVVEAGGCAGYQYEINMVGEKAEEDLVFEKNGSEVLADDITMSLISGSTVDFKVEMMRSSFSIENPKADKGCSCGLSFSLKEE